MDTTNIPQVRTITQMAADMYAAGVTASNVLSAVRKLPKAERTVAEKKVESLTYKLIALRCKADKAQALQFDKMQAKVAGMPLKTFRAVREKLQNAAGTFKSGYSMGEVVRIFVEGQKGNPPALLGYRDNCATYGGKAKKYTPRYGTLDITLTKREAIQLERIGGVYTIVGKEVAHGVRRCKWLAAKGIQGDAAICWRSGYITKGIHTYTVEGAIEHRAQMASNLWKKRQYAKPMADRIAAAAAKFVGFQHLANYGLCGPGAAQFIQEHHLDREAGYSVAYLAQLAQGTWAAGYVAKML